MSKNNLLNIFFNSVNKYNSNILFKTPYLKTKLWTYNDIYKLTNKYKFLFMEYNIKKNNKIIYIGNNSPYWLSANIATYQMNSVFVPIYENQHSEVINHIISETEPSIILGSDKFFKSKTFENIKNIKKNTQNIHFINYELDYEKIYEHSMDYCVETEDPSIILYTSGTTGLAKGVCLTQNNLCSNIESINKKIGDNFVTENDKYFNFLPWSHIYGLNCELYYGLSKGSSIFINDNINNIPTNIKNSEPSIICSVPKLLYSIYDKIETNKISKLLTTKPFVYVFRNMIRDKIFGPNLRFINSGGAPISLSILEFYKKLNIDVYQGYGLSETSPIISLNYKYNNKLGSVGKILDCNDVKLVDGEIRVKGSNVFKGYYKNKTETENAFDEEGYFRTGDLGTIDNDGYLYITGRCKDLYKLDNGKYINPSYIENILLESEFIQQICIYGDAKPYNIALIVLNNVSENNNLEKKILSEINLHSQKLKKYEIPEKILFVPPFTFEEKLLTAKLSLIRHNIYKKYYNDIQKLYTK